MGWIRWNLNAYTNQKKWHECEIKSLNMCRLYNITSTTSTFSNVPTCYTAIRSEFLQLWDSSPFNTHTSKPVKLIRNKPVHAYLYLSSCAGVLSKNFYRPCFIIVEPLQTHMQLGFRFDMNGAWKTDMWQTCLDVVHSQRDILCLWRTKATHTHTQKKSVPTYTVSSRLKGRDTDGKSTVLSRKYRIAIIKLHLFSAFHDTHTKLTITRQKL